MLFAASSADYRQTVEGRIAKLLGETRQLRLDLVKSSPPDFNMLSISGLVSDERQHSAIFAWLLDEAGSHGQGTLFLTAFAKLCGLSFLSEPTGYTVRSEFAGAEAIADIVVFLAGDFVIYVENKILAPLGQDQLGREERDLHRFSKSLRVPEHREIAVFLTLDGKPVAGVSSDVWRSLSHHNLGEMIRSLPPERLPAKLKLFLSDWLSLLQTLK